MKSLLFGLLIASSVEAHSKEVICLAKNIYYESRGETVLGQKLVAKVTLNRQKNKNFPNTICKVVYQPYQFSWTLKPYPIREYKSWNQALKIAEYSINTQLPELKHINYLYYTHKSIRLKGLSVKYHYRNHVFY